MAERFIGEDHANLSSCFVLFYFPYFYSFSFSSDLYFCRLFNYRYRMNSVLSVNVSCFLFEFSPWYFDFFGEFMKCAIFFFYHSFIRKITERGKGNTDFFSFNQNFVIILFFFYNYEVASGTPNQCRYDLEFCLNSSCHRFSFAFMWYAWCISQQLGPYFLFFFYFIARGWSSVITVKDDLSIVSLISNTIP